jgi:probable sporulation protein (polysaccharide deacetylase family)
MQRIEEEARKRNVKPIDARIDRIWKAIPGYNGLEVDVAHTFQINRHVKPDEKLRLVYQQTSPSIQLEQLPPYPIFKGNPHKPMISLMINVAWGNEYLPSMLKTLKDARVKASFFLDGLWLKKNQDVAKQIIAQGHELGNHAYSHKNMSKLSDAQALAEMSKTQRLLQAIGVESNLFAPPSGDFDERTVKIAHQLNMKTILWTIDTVDWMKPSSASVVHKITSRLEPGALILMHPTKASSEALQAMIINIKHKGYVLGTVSDLISSNRVPQVE